MLEAAGLTAEVEEMVSVPSITDEEKQWARLALSDFDKNNYDGTNGFLAKIANNRAADPKVIHNKAVVNYLKSGQRRTDEFKVQLKDVCTKLKVSIDNVSTLDDVDQCTVFYNYSLILYRLQQYHQAIKCLDKVFQFVEPMDEKLSNKVIFLLIELYLTTLQPEKAMGMINFLEKNASGNGKNADKDPPQEPVLAEQVRSKISHYKTRCYLMIKNIKLCKRELKTLTNSLGNQSAAMVYIKANYEYLRGNYRKAIKVLNTPQTQKPTHETGEHVPTMYYNNIGVVHFHMRKHNLGAFYFRKALHENQQIVNEFHKTDLSKSLSGRPLTTLGVNRHYYLLYNMGIQLLHCSQPSAAFDCLIETIQLYQVNPRLWLRLAECCIMAHRATNDEDRKLCNRLKVVQCSVGSGIHKKLVLGPGLKDDRRSAESAAIPNTTLEFASLCLKNSLFLLNKAFEVPEGDEATTRPSIENLLVAAPPGNPLRLTEVENLRCSVLAAKAYVCLSLNDHTLALKHARDLLKQPRLSGAHKYLAHMYLAEALVAVDKIADAIQELKPDDVQDVGTVFPAGSDNKQELDKGDKNGDKDGGEQAENPSALQCWAPKDVVTAKAYMQYNLATSHAIRGEYEKALVYLKMSSQNIGTPLPAQMYFLNIYLELMEGKRKNAYVIIKEHFGHMTSSRPGA